MPVDKSNSKPPTDGGKPADAQKRAAAIAYSVKNKAQGRSEKDDSKQSPLFKALMSK